MHAQNTKYLKDLSALLTASPTPWHTAAAIRQRLLQQGFKELFEADTWELSPESSYFTIREDAAVAVFKTPKQISASTQALWIAAHTDSPSLVLKPRAMHKQFGYYTFQVELYGGGLWNSWLNRELGFGGRIFYQKRDGSIASKLCTSDFTVVIPQLAIHLDKNVNQEGLKLNPQYHLSPLAGLEEYNFSLTTYLESLLEPDEQLLDIELRLFDRTPPAISGARGDFLSAHRLDDLAMVHAGLTALLEAEHHETALLGCLFVNHEEVGSISTTGMNSSYFPYVSERIFTGMGVSRENYLASLGNSLLISADMAHAMHPGWPEKHDPAHAPIINCGPVIKWNANQRYATSAKTASAFRSWAKAAGVPVQEFVSRNDQPCGSTIGPAASAATGIPTVDIGNPMLSMHAIRELVGSEDHGNMIRVFAEAFTRGV